MHQCTLFVSRCGINFFRKPEKRCRNVQRAAFGGPTATVEVKMPADISTSISKVRYVIWDLDGTILDTESVVQDIASEIVSRYGKKMTPEVGKALLGTRPLDGWTMVANELEIQENPEDLYGQSQPLLLERWPKCPLMPGALRTLRHLQAQGIPMALATSSLRKFLPLKLQEKDGLMEMFETTVCGDEVEKGKPHPDIFLKAAEELGAKPEDCLVFEDAPYGAEGAVAAGMKVVVVPSMTDRAAYPDVTPEENVGVIQMLSSLLEFNPDSFGLPGFTDYVAGSIPVSPELCMKGTVVKGFGRGSKELGIPTANLAEQDIHSVLAETVTGIYYGWASLGASPVVYKMVMSIGWNPYYKNEKKTAEAWLLHDFKEDFYGEELRLVVCGYVRAECDFKSVDELIARIHKDADVAREALDSVELAKFKTHKSLAPSIEN